VRPPAYPRGVPRPPFALVFGLAAAAGLLAAAPARAAPARALPFIEVVTGGARAEDSLPLVIALHGRGDTAEGFATLFRQLPARARVAILRPPHDWGGGQAWFLGGWGPTDKRPAVAAELLAHADRVVATADAIRASRPTRGKPVVMGFSQGGMLAWAVAVKHPRAFAAAFPVAGFFFPEMLDRTRIDAAAMPPIVAFHGGADRLVSVDEDRQGAQLLQKRGARVDLRIHPGVGHELPPAMSDEMFASLSRALAR
jgi:phospholipase/carboxylesterase